MAKEIVVSPYHSDWPQQFEVEAERIKAVLGSNCVAVHHVGSTAVPGLSAKPKIDIIAVVDHAEKIIGPLESIGYEYRGEYNIPFHYGFSKRGAVRINLHVYEEGHPEIELNLLFRDYLCAHPEAREEYGKLKEVLLQDKTSHEKSDSIFTGYNLGKDAFIRRVLKAAGYQGIRLLKCTHYAEWEAARQLRQKYFLRPNRSTIRILGHLVIQIIVISFYARVQTSLDMPTSRIGRGGGRRCASLSLTARFVDVDMAGSF